MRKKLGRKMFSSKGNIVRDGGGSQSRGDSRSLSRGEHAATRGARTQQSSRVRDEHGRHPKFDRNIRCVIGLHSAREALRVRPNKIKEIWLRQGADRITDLNYFIVQAHQYKIPVQMKADGVLDQIATSHQGICLLVTETPELDLEKFATDDGSKVVLLALDEVTDPHNVGAMLRSAWLFGISGLIAPENRSSHLTPAAIKVASGAAEHVPFLVTQNLANELNYLKDKGFWIYGLSGEATNSLTETQFSNRVVIVVGAEDKGLRSTTTKVCDDLIAIPQQSAPEAGASFNASVAAAIVMYEVGRQHKIP